MIQLKVYSSPDITVYSPESQWGDSTNQLFLDLYDTEPIKLTLSIEDLTNADATSTYSKTFKVPGTRKNAEFFKNSFDVDGIMYDVTIKKPAEILVDGTQFKQGHIRLQKVYLNIKEDRYDYELLFLGETRDFSSIIGDKGLCDLIMNDINGGDIAGSFLSTDDVIQSWQAYPENTSLTSGLHDGNIIYPLIDHGNNYDDTGTIEESRVAIGTGSTNTPNFTEGSGGNNSNPRKTIALERMKPMIRAKRIIDQIFEDAGYTYDSEFFESTLFHQIYISAFGNTATVELTTDASGGSENTAYGDNQTLTQHTYDRLQWQNNWVDPGNNLSNPPSSPYGTVYNAPGAGTYDISARCFYVGSEENSDGSRYYIRATLQIYNYSTSTVLAQSVLAGGTSSGATLFASGTGLSIGTGDKIGIQVIPENSTYQDLVNNVVFEVTSAPGRYSVTSGLDCQYKQIDFVKDILTSFRLVLSPDANDPKNFIIEPWQTYINSGNLYDWSDKLVENKDIQIEPVFFSQSDEINFKFQEGGDYTNIYHQQSFKEIYGQLDFKSGNDLLKGTREVKLLGIAPTELVNIQGASANDFVPIPQLHTHSSEDTGLQHLPIKPKTRILFYNGLQPFTVPGNPHDGWYLQNDPNKKIIYPLVSPYENWPITTTSLNLNFSNDIQYWGTRTGYNDTGVTLYENYWSRYIASLYNKYSRRVTANFVLNNIDLNEFTFDDTIFINGTYYRPEKIIDVQVGAYTEVLVQLLTANDYVPTLNLLQELIVNSVTTFPAGCFGSTGYIVVDTQGTPGFTWALSNGQTGAALQGASPGNAPYVFTILNVAPGTYTLTITDSLGRTKDQQVTIGQTITNPPTATTLISTPTNCTSPCNGSVAVNPTGGSGGPYTVTWSDGVVQTSAPYLRTDMCPGQYDFYVTDSSGCSSVSYLVQLECDSEYPVYTFARHLNSCTQLSTDFRYVSLQNEPDLNTTWKLEDLLGSPVEGCWIYIGTTGANPDSVLVQSFETCEVCEGIQSGNNYEMTNCDPLAREQTTIVDFGIINPGGTSVWELNGTQGCWQVTAATLLPAGPYTPAVSYDNCVTCSSGPTVTTYIIDDCISGLPYTVPRGNSNFNIGDIIQWTQIGGGAVYCGTIDQLSTGTPDAELFNDNTTFPGCDDEVHCLQ